MSEIRFVPLWPFATHTSVFANFLIKLLNYQPLFPTTDYSLSRSMSLSQSNRSMTDLYQRSASLWPFALVHTSASGSSKIKQTNQQDPTPDPSVSPSINFFVIHPFHDPSNSEIPSAGPRPFAAHTPVRPRALPRRLPSAAGCRSPIELAIGVQHVFSEVSNQRAESETEREGPPKKYRCS